MLDNTFKYLRTTLQRFPIPKSRDPRHGYWNVQCIAVAMDDTELTFAITCEDWLDTTFTLPIPKHLDTLCECIHLSISEMIVKERIEYLCSLR